MIKTMKLYCQKFNIDWKFIKFLFVGGINTLFGYTVFAVCNFLGLHYSVSTLIATILGILFNFKTTGIIVFKSHDNGLIFKFLGVYGLVYFITLICLKLLSFICINMYVNYAILLLPNAFISYVLMKKFVFLKEKDVDNEKCSC